MKPNALVAALGLLFAASTQGAVTEFIVYKEPNFRGDSHVVKGEVNQLGGEYAGTASSLVVRGGFWEICNDDHFKGECRVLAEGEYPRLGPTLRHRVVSIRFLGTDPKLAQRVAPEDRRLARNETVNEPRNEARNERRETRPDWRMTPGAIDLYGRPAFRGRSLRLEETARDLYEHRFDGRASSAIVHNGAWQLCTGPEFSGRCSVLEPGQYPQLAMLDDRVSSVRRLR
jgi:hypothetical protein